MGKMRMWVGMGGLIGAIALPVSAADINNGGQLYARHCQTCHGDRGRPMMPGMPDFTRGEKLFQADASLVSSIKQGKSVMPAYRGLLTDEEILDVVAYLRTLRR